MTTINVTGWHPGFKTISFIKLLRDESAEKYGLSDAKALVDALLEGRPFSLRFEAKAQAERFIAEAKSLGAVASFG